MYAGPENNFTGLASWIAETPLAPRIAKAALFIMVSVTFCFFYFLLLSRCVGNVFWRLISWSLIKLLTGSRKCVWCDNLLIWRIGVVTFWFVARSRLSWKCFLRKVFGIHVSWKIVFNASIWIVQQIVSCDVHQIVSWKYFAFENLLCGFEMVLVQDGVNKIWCAGQ